MTETVTLVVKLRLRDKHSKELRRQARSANFVWNFCNETSRQAWSRDHRWLSGFDLGKLAAGAGRELDLLGKTVEKVCHQFARSRDKAKRAGLRWRSRKSLGWVPFGTGDVRFDGAVLIFRGRSYEPMHLNPRLTAGAKIGIGSFSQDARGRWYANLPIKIECNADTLPSQCGIDLGLKSLATLSTGDKIEAPRFYRQSEKRLATAQRARKTTRARAIHAKIANRRKDFMHKASSALAKEYGLIVVGDVSPSKLARTRMAKSVLDAGWSDFRTMLSYKAQMHGGRTIEVSERLTTQTCSECGSLPPSRPEGIAGLGIREWQCDGCGAVLDRDVNAAQNILRLGLQTLGEGAPILGRSQRTALGSHP